MSEERQENASRAPAADKAQKLIDDVLCMGPRFCQPGDHDYDCCRGHLGYEAVARLVSIAETAYLAEAALRVIAVDVAKAMSVTAAIGAKGFYITPEGAARMDAALRAAGRLDEPQVSAAEPPPRGEK